MRLSEILSKEPSKKYYQVEGFLEKALKYGKQKKIDVGTVTLSFYCKSCEDILTFSSVNQLLTCMGIDNTKISINTVLKCPRCNQIVPIWFLIESNEKKLTAQYPEVRVLKRSYKLLDYVSINNEKYGKYSELLEKANLAYQDELGTGAIIYLRKIYEQIVIETANIYEINNKTARGRRRKFSEILEEVDNKASIIPREFSRNGYTLFDNLSNIIHGEYDEEIAINNYPAFYRLIIGILDNINNNKELLAAVKELNWDTEGEKNEPIK